MDTIQYSTFTLVPRYDRHYLPSGNRVLRAYIFVAVYKYGILTSSSHIWTFCQELNSGFILQTRRKKRTSSSGRIATRALVKGCCHPTHAVHSEQDGRDLLPESGWEDFGSFCLLQGRNSLGRDKRNGYNGEDVEISNIVTMGASKLKVSNSQ